MISRSGRRIAEQYGMAQPDRPNFSILGRIVFGTIAIVVIVSLLYFFRIL
jgi:hypothetical protein